MGLLFNKCRIFISHKRKNGQATPDTILIKDIFKQKWYFKPFIDVHEDTLGNFPDELRNRIEGSNVFVLVIPSNGDVSFLYDTTNWVYKEVHHALLTNLLTPTKKDKKSDKIQILPVTTLQNFKWPQDPLPGIDKLKNYDVRYVDTSNPNFKERLQNAIKFKPSHAINMKGWTIMFILLLGLVSFIYNKYMDYTEKKEITQKIELIKGLWEAQGHQIETVSIADSLRTDFIDSLLDLQKDICNYYKLTEDFSTYDFKMANDHFSKKIILQTLREYKNIVGFSRQIDLKIKTIIKKDILLAYLVLINRDIETDEYVKLIDLEEITNRIEECLPLYDELSIELDALDQAVTQDIKKNEIAELYTKVNNFFCHNATPWVVLDNQRDYYKEFNNMINEIIKYHIKTSKEGDTVSNKLENESPDPI